MSAPSKKEILFAVGFLRGLGLSPEYSAIIAERILEPGAVLSESDAGYLKSLRLGQRMLGDALDPRWGVSS